MPLDSLSFKMIINSTESTSKINKWEFSDRIIFSKEPNPKRGEVERGGKRLRDWRASTNSLSYLGKHFLMRWNMAPYVFCICNTSWRNPRAENMSRKRDELTQFCVLLYWLPRLMCHEFKRQPWHSPDSRAKLRHALLEGEIPAPVLRGLPY